MIASKSNISSQKYDDGTVEKIKNQLDHIQRLAGMVEQAVADARTILCAYMRRNKVYDYQCMNEMIVEAEKNAEYLTDRLRRMVLQLVWEPQKYGDYRRELVHTHGICISYEDGILSADIPALIPHRKAVYTDYIYMPLYLAFRYWCIGQSEKKMEIPKYETATVCFIHCYDKRESHGRVRDNDNIEEKHVLDALNAFFLKTDSGLCVNTYHAAVLGEADRTYLFVVPNDRFMRWLSGENRVGFCIEKNTV